MKFKQVRRIIKVLWNLRSATGYVLVTIGEQKGRGNVPIHTAYDLSPIAMRKISDAICADIHRAHAKAARDVVDEARKIINNSET
jgi:hypothetical protein